MSRSSWRVGSMLGSLAATSAIGILLALAPPAVAATHVVQITDSAFGTPVVTVQVGDTVTWTNVDDRPHTVTSDGAFDSGNIDEGGSYSFTFTEPGTYTYVCQYHPDMRATVIVQGSPSSTPAQAAPAPASATEPPDVNDVATSEVDAAHGAGHPDQPDTAIASDRPLPAASILLWGLGLIGLAVAVVPSRRPGSTVAARPPGGRRR